MKQKMLIIAWVVVFALSAGQDAGAQWVQTKVLYGNEAFAVNDGNLFAGTRGGGVLISTDNGVSWAAADSGLTSNVVRGLAVIGTNLFAGTDGNGVFLSTNNGVSWMSVGSSLKNSNNVSALAVIGTNLFAGTDGGGVFISTNNGASWTATDTSLVGDAVYSFAVNGTNLYARTGVKGVFCSSNNGTNWTVVDFGVPTSYAFATNGTNLFDGTWNGVFLSTNNGTTWKDAGLANIYIGSFAVDGSNLFAGTSDSGVYLSTDSGTSWAAVNTGLPLGTSVSALVVCGTNLVAGTSDSSMWYRPLSQMINPSAVAATPQARNSISAYPNPFSQSNTINFSSPESGVAEVTIVNLLGSEVKRIFSGEIEAGTLSFAWDASGMPPGMYECVVRLNGKAQQIPIVLER
jgi:hypothetical protein